MGHAEGPLEQLLLLLQRVELQALPSDLRGHAEGPHEQLRSKVHARVVELQALLSDLRGPLGQLRSKVHPRVVELQPPGLRAPKALQAQHLQSGLLKELKTSACSNSLTIRGCFFSNLTLEEGS